MVSKLHSELQKVESLIPVQVRTGQTVLAEFLYSREVPGVLSAHLKSGA
jgi:hypothetical protein